MNDYYTLLHEIFHILAITPPLFQYFQNQPVYTDSERSSGTYKVILPEVNYISYIINTIFYI